MQYHPAFMQVRPPLSWDSVSFVLSLHRAGSVAAAARALGVDGTTVSRRLVAVEHEARAPLFVKSRGSLRATDAGRRVVEAANLMEAQMQSLDLALAGKTKSTRVRAAMTEAVAALLVTGGAEMLRSRLADLELELVVGNQVADLSRREADLALRLVRPTSPDLVVKLVGRITFGLYASTAYLARRPAREPHDDLRGHDVVVYSGPLARSPEGEWTRAAGAGARVAVATSSLPIIEAAVASGLGVGVLPRHLGDRRPDLRLLAKLPAIPARPFFLVLHRDLRSSEPVQRCAAVLTDLFRGILSAVV